MKSIDFFDIDLTLWNTNNKIVVINKQRPEKILFEIPYNELSGLKTFYKKDNNPVYYNGKTFYLPNKYMNKIDNINNVGISFRDYNDPDMIKKQISKTDYLMDNIKHLKNTNSDIALLSARSNLNNHRDNIKVLNNKIISVVGRGIKKVYFVNDLDNNLDDDISANRKATIILEHLIGLKIKNERFIPLKQSHYNNVSLYDDMAVNINLVNDLQKVFDICIANSDDYIRDEILNFVDKNDLFYNTYKITNNKIEPFIENKQKLLSPYIIKRYK